MQSNIILNIKKAKKPKSKVGRRQRSKALHYISERVMETSEEFRGLLYAPSYEDEVIMLFECPNAGLIFPTWMWKLRRRLDQPPTCYYKKYHVKNNETYN